MASSSFKLLNSITGESLVNDTVEIAETPFSYPFLTLGSMVIFKEPGYK